ncbi:MAG: response regulator [Gammaproteobacteria bacterium]|nr:response regulator [Gammaproteobacteria bacterium]NIR96968.1 response regulator [Gammaproteobacteria bacterium]NIT62670.1 response regulator [Gammaproteobacteria bacterium]NIV19630.1 response regulator [Gammaproteobacteria bacterium]NIX10850.1 response regulator [Gammaproteobacteria bacterium]
MAYGYNRIGYFEWGLFTPGPRGGAVNRADDDKPYLTPNQVAELLMVSPVTVRRWARLGRLNAASTPGGHRRFRREDVERFAREHGLAVDRPAAEPLRVLVVDDDRQFAEYVAELLARASERVVTALAYDGFDAGHQVHAFRPHIVLLDLMMPGLDGVEVCRLLKSDAVTRGIRVVAMTGYPSHGRVDEVLAAGAVACLAKPFKKQELLDAVGLPPEEG